mmetsp:Transcript_12619/g.56903  ORF Transcript_12619/g.56903 Transcript_12619/m.56903 type:complete len:249 (+) Transcript_12619:2418-3164(+)
MSRARRTKSTPSCGRTRRHLPRASRSRTKEDRRRLRRRREGDSLVEKNSPDLRKQTGAPRAAAECYFSSPFRRSAIPMSASYIAEAPRIELCTRRIGVSIDLTLPPTPAARLTDPVRFDTEPVSAPRTASAAARLASSVLASASLPRASTSSSGSTGRAPPSLRYLWRSTVDMASSSPSVPFQPRSSRSSSAPPSRSYDRLKSSMTVAGRSKSPPAGTTSTPYPQESARKIITRGSTLSTVGISHPSS